MSQEIFDKLYRIMRERHALYPADPITFVITLEGQLVMTTQDPGIAADIYRRDLRSQV